MRFSKRHWHMSIKRFLSIFDRALEEVSRGREIHFDIRRDQRLTPLTVMLVPRHERDKHPTYRPRKRLRMCRRQQRKW